MDYVHAYTYAILAFTEWWRTVCMQAHYSFSSPVIYTNICRIWPLCIIMGSHAGAEICKLAVDRLILLKLGNIYKKNTSLYHNYRLVLLWNMNAQGAANMRNNFIKLLKEVRFQLKIETSLKKVDFLIF